ncbi:hypothetical protein FACS1894167_03460 [Synergistales bacterium]|nr:hypothetical protein FACS1894167_03460 [Synergistales bacterium]
MQVLFDLRPRNLVQLQSNKLDLSRVLTLILFTVLICLSLVNIGYTGIKLKGARGEIAGLRAKDGQIVATTQSLLERLVSMREMKERVTGYIAFTRQELPIIEFLSVLENCVVPGLKVTNLEIRQGSVSMQGLAVDDKSILDFSTQLNEQKGVVTNVNAPVTTKTTLGSRMINDFRVGCQIKGITDITTDITSIMSGSPSRQKSVSGDIMGVFGVPKDENRAAE